MSSVSFRSGVSDDQHLLLIVALGGAGPWKDAGGHFRGLLASSRQTDSEVAPVQAPVVAVSDMLPIARGV